MSTNCKLSANNFLLFFALTLAILIPLNALAFKAQDYNWIPPFLARDEKPSIIIIFDNSGSMLGRAYTGAFDPAIEYYGYFDSRTYYSYYDVYGTSNDYFYPNNSTGNWNGNWLNWAIMHRVDVARKVMGGGYYVSGHFVIESQDSANRVATFSYDDSAAVQDLNNDTNYTTPWKNSIGYIDHYESENILWMYVNGNYRYYKMRLKAPQQEGVLHKFKDKARMALFVYDYDDGGRIRHYMSEDVSTLNSLINTINSVDPTTWTPLAETLHTVYGYVQQDNSTTDSYGPRYLGSSSYDVGTTTDPFYFSTVGDPVWCTKQNIILITDGESTQDLNIPSSLRNLVTRPRPLADYNLESYGSTYLIDIAYKGHTSDLRPALPGIQNWDLYPIFAFGTGSNLLQDAARFGKFNDLNGNNLPDLQAEYDADGDGKPDNYFEAESGQELEAAITQAFQLATASIASGTAAAVTSQTRSGEGGVYQALFFPPTNVNQVAPAWSGQVHAFLLDARGNMREDTNSNKKLDLVEDKVIEFDGELIYAHHDANGDSVISAAEKNATALESINIINFLWSTSDWLNSLSDPEAISQRSSYASASSNRYIFTFVDKDQDMVADYGAGEIQDFELISNPTNLNSSDYFHNYLTFYEASSDNVALDLTNPAQSALNTLRNTNPTSFATLMATLAKRQVDYIRGADVGNQTIAGYTDAVRSRTFNGNPWRLGDIIFSSPTVVGKPSDNYHQIYHDKTYEDFLKAYLNRRQMIYAGANDGMLHAFNGGFYNSTEKSFEVTFSGETQFPLGMETWAYVPYNLLPHLKWLMDKEYGIGLHAAFMDLKPRVFDARVFFLSDGITPINSDIYPNGWGTILVAGMRLGGAKIVADIDKADGNVLNPNLDRTMTSAYVIMDITNPEQAPILLGEITMPSQGFTTCYPTVMPMSTRNSNTATNNQWFLVFGSGPANNAEEASRLKLGVETSDQTGKLYVLDLKALVAEKTVKSIDSSGTLVAGGSVFATTEAGSFISDPIAVDLDIGPYSSPEEFKTDVVYFGSVAGDQAYGRGKMYRLLTGNDYQSPMSWSILPLIDVGQPITSAPSVAIDEAGQLWVYFGTGRFFNRDDIPQSKTMSFYGVKEPSSGVSPNLTPTWATVSTADLFNSTQITMTRGTCGTGNYGPGCVQIVQNVGGSNSTQDWLWLTSQVDAAAGWHQDFTPAYERVLGQAAVLGGAVIFTSYEPSNDVCSFEGSSNLWALYYKTGTAYYRPILGVSGDIFNTSIDLGQGMALTPNLHVGEKSGSTAFIQSSTGAIEAIELVNPIDIKSTPLFWRKNVN